MILQKTIKTLRQSLSDLIDEGSSLRKTAGKLVSDGGGDAVIYVNTLFGGDDRLTRLFTDASANLGTKAKLEHLHIPYDINADLPLILISDDTELDNQMGMRLENRKRAADAPFFPLIIFSDEYFELDEGESLGYVQTCGTLKDISGRPIMAFRSRDLFEQREMLSMYIECVALTVTMYILGKKLGEEYEKNVGDLKKLYDEYTALPSGGAEEVLKKLSLNIGLRIYADANKLIKKLMEELKVTENKLDGFVNSLKDEYDRHIDNIITHSAADNSSAYSAGLNLKYGPLNNYLEKLCGDIERDFSGEELSVDLLKTVSDTRSAIASKAAELSFIGTFSSGKTTLINTLLGHKHKLRTSGAHNTAVLMELAYTQGKEYYELEYKDTLKWDLINYKSFENKNIINTFDCDAKVISVVKNPSGSVTIHYQSVESKEIRTEEIGSGHSLNVVKGTLVGSHGSFIRQDVYKDVVKLCSLNELKYIKHLLSLNSVSGVKLSTLDGDIRNINQISRIIDRLMSLYPSTARKNTQPSVTVEQIRNRWGNDFDKFEKCTFECKLSGFKNKSFALDEAGWDRFTGNEEKNIAPFCESPECYMPARTVKLYLNSEFLKYCSITDTPGFGSINDEHDAITERYIRDSGGKLIVMVSITNNSADMKLEDLLYNLSNIYRNFRKEQMGDVCFVLNCFTNLLPLEQCRKTVKDIQRKIKELGFTNNEIYVDNLKEVLKSNTDRPEFIAPFPSYYSFKSKCLDSFLEASVHRRYEKLHRMWESFFHDNVNWLKDRTDSLNRTLNSKQERVAELKKIISQIKSVEIDDGESLIQEIRKVFDEYVDGFEGAFRGNGKHKHLFSKERPRKEAVNAMCDSFESESDGWRAMEEELADRMKLKFETLSYYAGERSRQELSLKPDKPLIVATFIQIRSKLNEADDKTHWYNKKRKSNDYMADLRNTINQDKEETTANIREFCRKHKKSFDAKKKFLLASFEDELEKSSDSRALQKDIMRFNLLRDKLHRYKKEHFDKIEFI